MPKAVALFSGGLDSILACALMQEQNVSLIALHFLPPFHPLPKKDERFLPRKMAHQLGIPLKIIPLRQDYISLIKNARYGYGGGMNPCIDCRIYTFTLARNFMEQIGADFVVTGEVLGERPMSQHRQAMELIERKSGLTGRLLRPLSARLLEPTWPEIQGLINREKLLAIQGRSRKPQMELAAKFGIREYPNPAGGCLLTDKIFARRLREALAHREETVREVKLLRIGRHFRLDSGRKVIVGRNERENRIINNLSRPGDTILEPVDIPGPTVLLLNSTSEEDMLTAARICARYSDCKPMSEVKVGVRDKIFFVTSIEEDMLKNLRID
ncbi:MAG: asparagine synthase-related protein [candidate division WOR-3 bacterium]